MLEEQFSPINAIEVVLTQAVRGDVSVATFVSMFLQSTIAVPSGTEVLRDGRGMTPVFFDKQGTQMLAVFTDLERAKRIGEVAPYCLAMNGKSLLTRLPAGFGIVVNPGYFMGLDISPAGIQEIIRDFASSESPR